MPKNKNMCGVACKPIHKNRDRCNDGNDPSIKFPIRLGMVTFLFFQVFVFLVILTVPTNVWAALTSMSVDASGDTIFRGGRDRVLITFTVDDRTDDDGDPYTVTATADEEGSTRGGGLIAQGTVLPNETVRIIWDGTINGQQLSDGEYTIKVTLNREKRDDEDIGDREKTSPAVTLDANPPVISSIVANAPPGGTPPPITEGSFVSTEVSSIKVTPASDEGSSIDFGRNLSNLVLKNEQGVTVEGSLSQEDNALTLTLGNRLDAPAENGTYTLEIRLTDSARNTLQSEVKFFFDNVPPDLVNIATSRGVLTSGGGINEQISYVEARLADNLPDGLDLLASKIRLTGPNGPVPGRQTLSSTNRIRWRFLSPLSPAEGLQDGTYTIEVTGVDKADNTSEPITLSFRYDNVAPRLVSLSPAQDGEPFKPVGGKIYYNLPVTEFVATFDDEVKLISEQRNATLVFGTPKAGGGINVIAGHSSADTDSDTLTTRVTHVLADPILSRDGSQDGSYVLNVRATDTLGNTRTYSYEFIYDTQSPTLLSTVPAANETVSSLSQVTVKLDEKTSGIDFIESNFRLSHDGTAVPVDATSSGTDTATLTLAKLIALDGSDDGTYTIEVTPTDRAGNTGVTAVRKFYLVSEKHQPEIQLTMPETTNVNNLVTVTAQLINYVGVGIDLDASTMTVRNPQGVLVRQEELEQDETSNLLTWTAAVPVARDGSADGEYIVAATFVDFIGQRVTREFPIVLDTQIPALVSTVPAANEIVSELSQVEVKLSENTSGIDFDQSSFRLLKGTAADILEDAIPGEQRPVTRVLPVNVNSDGTDTVTLTLLKPIALDGSDDGTYTIEVSPIDRAGNAGVAVMREFYLVSQKHEPEVRLVMPETSIVNGLPTSVVVELVDYIGAGVDFDASTLSVRNPQGALVPEEKLEHDETSRQLTWRTLAAVPRDGSADGEYTITATFIDFTERRFTQEFTFVLDTQIPALVSTVPAANQTVSALSQVQVRLSEVTSGIDFLQSTFQLTHGDAAVEVPVNITSNGANTVTLTLAAPIALDGSDDGTYAIKVAPTDRAGNMGVAVVREFYLVSQKHQPEVRLVMPETTIFNTLPRLVVVELVDYLGAGIDFDASTLSVRNPRGALIPEEKLEHDEANYQLTWRTLFTAPRDGSADGEYTVTATFVDFTGRRFTQVFTIVLNTLFPTVKEVQVATGSPTPLIEDRTVYISEPIVEVTVVFDETSNDVDFEATVMSLVKLKEDGTFDRDIPITTVNDGQTALTIRSEALTQDGEYELSITPRDRAGNEGGVIYRKFVYDTEAPQINDPTTGPTPLIFNQQPVTYIGNALRQFRFEFTVTDVGPAGLYLEDQTLEVTSASGINIPIAVTYDELTSKIFLALPPSFPRDGSVDGEYTVKVSLVDKAGNRSDSEYTAVYDSTPPQIASVVIDADPQVVLVPNRIAKIVEPINRITLQFEEATRINFANTQITLTGPGAPDTSDESTTSSIPLTLEDDGVSQVTLSFLDVEQVGTYTLSVAPQDVAGNAAAGAVEYRFILDMPLPSVSSVVVGDAEADLPIELIPNRVAEITEAVNRITLQFESPTQIDFANTEITLMGPEPIDTSGDAAVPTIPLTYENDGVSQMTLSFLNLEQIGTYTLSVTPQDIAGNAAAGAVAYRFILDIPLPRVGSVIIGETETQTSNEVAYVNANNMRIGALLLDPTETGLSFGSEGSIIQVTQSDGTGEATLIRGRIGSNGEDLIVWEPVTLTADGTTDGRYDVVVVPIDKAGRQGNPVYREFIYDTQEPEIIGAGPPDLIDLSQPVSYISRSLTQFNFTVADVGPADLELADQEVSLRDAGGSLVPTHLTNDTANRLFLTLDQPLPLDGSMDGEYTLLIALADKAGNRYTVEHLIVYDTQAPTLVSTVPADGALLTEDVTEVQVRLNDAGGSGIDWSTATVTLVNPSGTEISGELVSNGTTALTLTTNQLVEDGRYIIRVQAADRAGNGAATVFERSFLLSRRLPAIVSTEPSTAPADEAFTNEVLERIEVTIETDDRNHLSTLRLLNPATQVVVGQQQRATDRLVYNLVRPLATDGSEDGIYTIEFTPISASGRSGEVQRLTFTYDTQSPEIETDDAINLVVAEPEVNNSLTEIRVNLTDETSGIDWEDLDEEWLIFERLSPNPTKISGRISDDGESNLTFRLTVPLADNGSADGEYQITVSPKDRAGNDDEPYERVFIYDTSPPMIDPSTLLINEVPLLVDINAENYPTAVSTTGGVVIQTNIFDTGLGANLAQSKVVVRSPDGSEISGNTQQNGVDTLIFKSEGLRLQGVYQVTVTSIGNDSELLGFAPTDSLTTEFLYETTVPTAAITSDGGETELTDKALPLEGTASDPSGTQRVGEGEITVPASGIWLVEIVGTGPNDQPIDPVAAVDDSSAEQEPWSTWSIDFLPTRSGEYDLDVRVTDNAGNYEVYDIGEYTMSVSLTFRGNTFGWPNPLRLSKRDVAFFSFDVNVPLGETIELTLSIYDWSGDMVLSQTYPDVVSGQRNDQLVKWNLENQAGTPVARGLYIFRLEAVNAAGNRANVVGKVLVVD